MEEAEQVTRLAQPNRIAELRKVQGITRTEVGFRLRVSEATVTRWEKRTSGIPDRHKVELADLFGVSVPWLMYWEDGGNGNGEAA